MKEAAFFARLTALQRTVKRAFCAMPLPPFAAAVVLPSGHAVYEAVSCQWNETTFCLCDYAGPGRDLDHRGDTKSLIVKKTPAPEIKAAAVKKGMKTLRMIGLERVKEGLTTLEEVLRVTGDD